MLLYARVSEARDGRSASVDDQLAGLRGWAGREGWPIIDAYRDDNISASRYAESKRPGWRQTMDTVASGRVRGLLLWEFSRSTRDLQVYAELEAACRAHRVQLGYSGRLYDLSSATDGFSAGIDALSAVRHSAETSERVRRAVDSRAAKGRPHGGLPDGLRRVINPRTGATVGHEIDPARGPLIQEIVRRLLADEPADGIAKDLTGRGILTATGKPWRGGNLSKLVLRPAYAGLRVYHGEVLEGVETSWPALISVEDHWRLVAKFDDPARDKWRNPTHIRHLGTGLYRCGREGCDGRMRVVSYPQGSAYGCRVCCKVSRRQADVDEWVEAVMIARLSRPDFLDVLRGSGGAEERKEAAAEVAMLRAEMARARGLLKAGDLTVADFAAFRSGWTPRMAAAEAAAQPRALNEAAVSLAGLDAGRRWKAAPITVRRTTVDALATVTILPTGRKGGTPQPFNPELVRIEWKGSS